MSDPATNENLREGRGERGDFGKDQRVGMKKGWQTKHLGDVAVVGAGNSAHKMKPCSKTARFRFSERLMLVASVSETSPNPPTI